MCIPSDFPWGKTGYIPIIPPGGNLVYIRFSGGKFEYIPIFQGGNSSMGEKLGCNIGPFLTQTENNW